MPGGFQSYDCEEDQILGLNVEFLAKSIGRINERCSVEISSDKSDDVVSFAFFSPSNKTVSKVSLFLMTIDDDAFDIPMLQFTSSFTVPSIELRRICKSLVPFGDTLVLLVKVDEIRFSVMGAVGFASTSIRKPLFSGAGMYGGVVIDCSTEVVQKLSLSHMIRIVKATPLAKDVVVTLSSEGPIKIEYRMGDLGYITYYLAPKIEEH